MHRIWDLNRTNGKETKMCSRREAKKYIIKQVPMDP